MPRPVEAVNVSPAYLFRKVADEAGSPTVLFDEIDTVFGPKAKDNEEIRGLLNAGHRRGAVAGRCVISGKTVETEELPAYCAVAMAGLGYLPDTIFTRSIIINMRRRAPDETVEPFRRRLQVTGGEELRDRLAIWTGGIFTKVQDAWPVMPDGIADRNADVWEAPIAIADAAGGEWPRLARVAAVTLVTSSARGEGSLGIRLLTDIRTVFGNREAMRTKELLNELINMDESIWTDLKGYPMTDRGLAVRLRPYGISSSTIRFSGDMLAKGYAKEDFYDAWQRYLPTNSKAEESVTNVTSVTDGDLGPVDVTDVTDVTHVSPNGGDSDPFQSFKDPARRYRA